MDWFARKDPVPEQDSTENAEWQGSPAQGRAGPGNQCSLLPCRQPAQKVCPFPWRSISHPQVLWKSALVMCMCSSQFLKPQLKSIKNVQLKKVQSVVYRKPTWMWISNGLRVQIDYRALPSHFSKQFLLPRQGRLFPLYKSTTPSPMPPKTASCKTLPFAWMRKTSLIQLYKCDFLTGEYHIFVGSQKIKLLFLLAENCFWKGKAVLGFGAFFPKQNTGFLFVLFFVFLFLQ